MWYIRSFVITCGLSSPFLRLWGLACRLSLASGSESKANFWWLFWFGKWKFGSLMDVWSWTGYADGCLLFSPSGNIGEVHCAVCCLCWFLLSLCLNEVPLSFMFFLGLRGPGSVFCSLPYQLYTTKLGGWTHASPSNGTFAPLPSLFSVSSFLHFPSILSITLLLSLEPSLALHILLFGWEKPELLSFHTSSFSTYPFALSLTFATVLSSFVSSCTGNSFCPTSSFCDSSNSIFHLCCCRKTIVVCLSHSHFSLAKCTFGISISLFHSLYSVQNVRPSSSPVTWPVWHFSPPSAPSHRIQALWFPFFLRP